MENNARSSDYKAHCMILPYPIQGHINPMLQFSKRLQYKGIKVTLATTKYFFKTMQEYSGPISVDTISDGCDEKGFEEIGVIQTYLERFRHIGTKTLKELVEKLKKSGSPLDCIIYDPFLPWALDVVKECGLVGAAFFTQSCAVDNIYYHVYKGEIRVPVSQEKFAIPGMPLLKDSDLPSFVYSHESYPTLLDMVVNQFQNIEKADWLLFNTFYKLEEEIIDWMVKTMPVKAIGPTIPSMYLDKRLKDNNEYGLSVYKPITDACSQWLDSKLPKSVIYVSFGSIAELKTEQMSELAEALKMTNCNFLWIVREKEKPKLPKDFVQETSEKGMVLSWCQQLDVLSHDSVGCFVTHCGWNSTLEALSLGMPMVGMPQWSDQSMNAKYIMDVWKMGIKVEGANEKGIVSREMISQCIRQVMEGEAGEEIRKNATKWMELARQAADEGGTSDTIIQEFTSSLILSST